MINNTKLLPTRILLILLLPFSFLLSYILSYFPGFVEVVYSNAIYKLIGIIISRPTAIIPFSLAEIIIVIVLLLIPIGLILLLYRLLLKKQCLKRLLVNFFIKILVYISLLYFIFIFIWGLNYHRLPFSQIANLKVEPSSIVDLENLCISLIERGNVLRQEVIEDSSGIMKVTNDKLNAFNRAYKGYEIAGKLYPELRGKYGRPKPVFFSEAMSYLGISGIYFPFTGEANVNVHMPDPLIPATITHEMAHQRGFAREDEANYIAYLACTLHPDVDFQYSGILLAIINSMNALYKYNPEKYLSLVNLYSDAVKKDINSMGVYWKKYEGPIERASTKMNDAYLKSNMQEDGVHSYGRMVDLLIADFKGNMYQQYDKIVN